MLTSASPDLFGNEPSPAPAKRSRSAKAQLGQFFTPSPIADFMAAEFQAPTGPVTLLDAGAGEGALTEAFIRRWGERVPIAAHLYEMDDAVQSALRARMASLQRDGQTTTILATDFLEAATLMLRLQQGARFTHAILNPPYRKIATASRERLLASSIGLETVNLYSAFVALALELMQPGGELVAIIPRSFCNGPYYRSFRRFIIDRAAIRSIHLFKSRSHAFSRDDVLQENVIIRLDRSASQGRVTVSTSADATFSDLTKTEWDFSEIVAPDDPELFIHVPTPDHASLNNQQSPSTSLGELGVQVSTGPVVDFRLRDHLRAMPEDDGDVPLLYPLHLRGASVTWPIEGAKKPNAISRNRGTEKWLFPMGWYAAVRRFSSKEERRRIVASVIDPRRLKGERLGLENHINVFHSGRQPLDPELAAGLVIYLNTSDVDAAFRRFNGHTQVNATDLRQMSYPTREQLKQIGRMGVAKWPVDQEATDELVEGVLAGAR